MAAHRPGMSDVRSFPGRLALQQRVLPDYRALFFDRLAQACTEGLSVFAGAPRPDEGIRLAPGLQVAAFHPATNIHIGAESTFANAQPGITTWLKAWDPAALILEANPRYLSNRAARRWMQRRGRPVLGWGLGAPPQSPPWEGIRRRYLLRFDGLIAYSSLGAEQYRRLGMRPDRVFVAPNAVAGPPPPLAPRPVDPDRPPRLLFVGRLQSRKRVDLLLRACGALTRPIELQIVGDGPERAALEQLAAEVFARAQFLGDRRGEALEALFRQADLFVLPGTGGLAVQQAMAHGLPVVVAEADGTQGELVGPENGWLVPPGDLPALEQALRQALADPPRLRRMGEASHRVARDQVNTEIMLQAFLNALDAVRPGG